MIQINVKFVRASCLLFAPMIRIDTFPCSNQRSALIEVLFDGNNNYTFDLWRFDEWIPTV